jgi:hypothetical protein
MKAKDILSVILVIVVFLCLPAAFFLDATGYTTLAIISLAVPIISIATMIIISQKSKNTDQKEFESFKANATKIKVSLKDYEIKSNSWTDEIIIARNKYNAAWNQVTGNPDRNIQKISRNVNHVTLKIKYWGKTIDYNFYVEKDTKTLTVLFEVQQETTLYVDRNDPDKKYLDLEFLGGITMEPIVI